MSAQHPLIHVADVHKTYQSGDVEVHALRGVSMDVYPGEFVAIMGSSGSGKSTLMNLLGCLDRPTKGSYLLANREVAKMGRNELAEVRNEVLGFVFQSFNLLTRTSALETTVLGSFALEFVVFCSPPPLTLAVLVTESLVLSPTKTSIVISG